MLEEVGIDRVRGFSTNVSNFRRTKAEHHYARWMVRELKRLGVKGTKYVVDTSRNGAKKPVDADALLAKLERAIERRDLLGENLLLKQKIENQFRFGNIIGKSKKMHEVLELVGLTSVARSKSSPADRRAAHQRYRAVGSSLVRGVDDRDGRVP